MGDKLNKKHVFITGAAAGIGRQLSLDLGLKEGCRLTLLDRDLEGLKQVAAALEAGGHAGPRPRLLRCDVTSPPELEAALATTGDGPLDILINSAGIFYSGSFEGMNMEDFARVIDVDLMGTIRITSARCPAYGAPSSTSPHWQG